MSLHLRVTSFVDFGQLSKITHTRTCEGGTFWRILQKSTLVPRTYTREEAMIKSYTDLDKCPKPYKIAALFEEAINAAGNVIGNVTVNVSCV